MKVLSLKEPWASLIYNKKKYIETRSWKTNYRGPIYIHASKTLITKDIKNNKNLMDIVGNDEMHYGQIICSCTLVDCVLMDAEFLKTIKKYKNEYVCGIYSLGRYAWILEDIKPLDNFISVNGHLGLWEYKDN